VKLDELMEVIILLCGLQQMQWMTGLRRTLHAGDYSSVHVPIYVSVLLMLLYIALGAMLFTLVEQWGYFVSSYFCFIKLSPHDIAVLRERSPRSKGQRLG